MTTLTKYDELRLKTDKQLFQLVSSELDLGICSAHQALKSAGNREAAELYLLRAKSACAKASRLLPITGDLDPDSRSSLESKLERLGRTIAAMTAAGGNVTADQTQVAALAHALWQARGCPVGRPEEDWFRAERALKVQAA